ncbi:hypothetical protein [Acaryochloris sp. IP29b_bin.148]|uniref:hypothetical protein n=1 Tax=Acaryochloris sp. IP29b_bin.148 TaxID=2969218 RepID=UPI0026212222|nr:hypothetical protein [Acaryochloris sp. IP29b_bin.148]
MSIFQSEVLEAQGCLNDQSTSVEIQGEWFNPGPAFNKSLRQLALEFCEEAASRGLQYILIEFPSYLMAWRCIRSTKPEPPSAPSETETVENISSTVLDTIEITPVTQASHYRNALPPPSDIVSPPALGIANFNHEFTSRHKEELVFETQRSVLPPPPDIVSQPALGIATHDDEWTSKHKEELTFETQRRVLPPPPDIVNHPALGIANLDEFTRQCKEELALYIGPMAEFMTQQTLSQSDELTPQDLIESLAKHISDAKAALSFRKACYSHIET